MSNKGKLFGGFIFLIGGFVLLIVLLTAGTLTYNFLKYRNAGLDGLQTAPQAVVAITSPQAFSQATEGSPMPVNVSSNGYQPLVSTELWVDGILMGVQAAPQGGPFKFNTTFLWSPGPAGEHSLVARTLDANGDVVMSAPIFVKITAHVPAEGADAAYDAGPAGVFPASSGGGGGNFPPVNPPGPDESESPAQVGLPTVGDWLVDITNTEPPLAPGLTATIDGCNVTLHIHDLSENEEGFRVFRSVLNAPGWTKIAELNSQSSTEWITYTDELKGSANVSYYVAAVNGVGQAKSNPLSVNLASSGCPAAENSQQILTIEPVSFHIDAAMDQAYCYRSMGGVRWERWPSDGFFLPGADGFDIQPYQMTFALNGLDGKPLIEKLDLYVECWGWAGSELTYLGKVHFASTDLFDLGEQEQEGGIFTMGLEAKFGKYDPYSQFKLYSPPENAEMPIVVAWWTYDPQVCKAHLPQEFQNALGVLLFCSPRPGYTIGPGTENPQPYLVWMTLENTCAAGECWSLDQLRADAKTYNGTLKFIRDIHYGNHDIEYDTPGVMTVDVAGSFCPETEFVTVQLWYYRPDLGEWFTSPKSNEVAIPCTAPLGNSIPIDITFDSLTLTNVDDDDGPPEDVELYGFFQAVSSDGSLGIRNLGYAWNFSNIGCPTEAVFAEQGANAGTGGCPNSYQDGTYSISDMFLCTSDYAGKCIVNISEYTDWLLHNNTIHLIVGDGDSINLQVFLVDFDSGTSNDPACFATITTSSNTLFEWATGTFNFTLNPPDLANGGCTVKGTISATP